MHRRAVRLAAPPSYGPQPAHWVPSSVPSQAPPSHPARACPRSCIVLQVIAQCQHCQAWHKLADAANLVEEIRYADLEDE